MAFVCADNTTQVDPSICLLHPDALDQLQLFRGDIVKVKSKLNDKETFLVVLGDATAAPGTVGLSADPRRNAGVKVGDEVEISIEALDYGKRVQFAVEHDNPESLFATHLQPFLKEAYRPVHIGDVFEIKGLSFYVTATEPAPGHIVTSETIVYTEGIGG